MVEKYICAIIYLIENLIFQKQGDGTVVQFFALQLVLRQFKQHSRFQSREFRCDLEGFVVANPVRHHM
jgi:hypothetical protein